MTLRVLREHAPQAQPNSTENRLRARGFWPLVEDVCRKHFVTPEETIPKKPRYTREIHMARCELFARIVATTNYGAIGVARLFGCDHTTVLYALKKHGNAQENPPKR